MRFTGAVTGGLQPEAENKPLVLHLIAAKVEALRTLHEALAAKLREKSWALTLERHDGGTAGDARDARPVMPMNAAG